MGKLDKAMFGERVLVEGVSTRKVSKFHGGFRVIIDGVYGVFVIEN